MTTQHDILFKPLTIEENAEFLGQHMPVGRAWDNKCNPDANMHKMIAALGSSFRTIQEKIEELAIEFNINTSILLLPDWEKSVGLPDECLGSLSDLERRRQEVINRLQKIPIVTLEEMQLLIDELFPDINITLWPGCEYYDFEYEFPFTFLGGVSCRFILVVEIEQTADCGFEYEFEIEFCGGVDTGAIKCILDKIIPANVVVVFEFVEP